MDPAMRKCCGQGMIGNMFNKQKCDQMTRQLNTKLSFRQKSLCARKPQRESRAVHRKMQRGARTLCCVVDE